MGNFLFCQGRAEELSAFSGLNPHFFLPASQQCRCRKNCVYPVTQIRKQVLVKPRIAPEPWLVARRGMRKRKVMRREIMPGHRRFGQRPLAPGAEKMLLRILPHQQGQLDLRQHGQQLRQPQPRTFTPRRQVAAAAPAGITVSHWNNCNTRLIMEGCFIYAHPFAQPVSARIVPRYHACMDARPRSLPYYENRSGRGSTKHRTRAKRQMPFTLAAIAYCGNERFNGRVGFFLHF